MASSGNFLPGEYTTVYREAMEKVESLEALSTFLNMKEIVFLMYQELMLILVGRKYNYRLSSQK